MSEWRQIEPDFRRLVFKRGVSDVAKSIPAGRATVYTWLDGRHEPRRVAVNRIREILEESKRWA